MKKRTLVFIGAGVLLVAAIICVILFSVTSNTRETGSTGAEETPPDPKITQMSAKYLFVGTTFWGRRTNQNARASKLGVKYPFSELDTLERDKYQAWIGGLECPITDNGHNYSEEEAIFKFRTSRAIIRAVS